MDIKEYTDKQIINELFRRIGEPTETKHQYEDKTEPYVLSEWSDNERIAGYSGFYTVFDFDGDNLKTIGAYE